MPGLITGTQALYRVACDFIPIKSNTMEERENNEFSWTALFLVTGISFIAFSIILKLLDGSHVSLFQKIGLGMVALGALAFLNKTTGRKEVIEKPRHRHSANSS